MLGKIIIDGTGDADLLPSAGAEFDGAIDPKLRSSMLALVFRVGNCDFKKYNDFREKDPKKAQELMGELAKPPARFSCPSPVTATMSSG